MLSVSGGNQECVQLLVAAGANIELEDVKGQSPLFVATSQKKPIIMKVGLPFFFLIWINLSHYSDGISDTFEWVTPLQYFLHSLKSTLKC